MCARALLVETRASIASLLHSLGDTHSCGGRVFVGAMEGKEDVQRYTAGVHSFTHIFTIVSKRGRHRSLETVSCIGAINLSLSFLRAGYWMARFAVLSFRYLHDREGLRLLQRDYGDGGPPEAGELTSCQRSRWALIE